VTLNRTQPIHVAFAVPAQLLAAIQRRTRSEISVVATPPGGGGAPVTGRLSFIDNTVDTSTSTVLLKATFDNRDDRLWPGMFVDVTVTLGEEPDRVVCPAAAVQTGQQGTYVFVVDDDKKVELRAVKVNRADDENAVIDEGLEGGETVVTDGQLRLVPGATVEIKNAGTDAVAAP
jgi:multidrug efflux system membrane fusion protein